MHTLTEARQIADAVVARLSPHCERIEIAGSIRRDLAHVKDIDIVAIPKPYETGLFATGLATVVDQWPKLKGDLPCRYTQRMLPEGIKLELFLVHPRNWGLIFAIRTGSADYAHHVLAKRWSAKGYHSENGMLYWKNTEVPIYEEADLFRICGLSYVEPSKRK